jgi:hypothetical protein
LGEKKNEEGEGEGENKDKKKKGCKKPAKCPLAEG